MHKSLRGFPVSYQLLMRNTLPVPLIRMGVLEALHEALDASVLSAYKRNKRTASHYKMHDILNIDRNVTMQKLGEMEPDDLYKYAVAFENISNFSDAGIDFSIRPIYRKFAKKYGYDLEMAMRENFVEFSYSPKNDIDWKGIFEKIIIKINPAASLDERQISGFHCSGHYVPVHDDDHITYTSRAQLMIIKANVAEHKLYSKRKGHEPVILTPKAGDIILLDTFCDHAVFPNQFKGAEYMAAYPLQCSALTLYRNLQ